MKKAIAVVTCLITLGPAMALAGFFNAMSSFLVALADSVRRTTVVVENHYPYGVERRVVKEVVRVGPHERRQTRGHKRFSSYEDEVVYGRVISVEPVYRSSPYTSATGSCVRYVDDAYFMDLSRGYEHYRGLRCRDGASLISQAARKSRISS